MSPESRGPETSDRLSEELLDEAIAVIESSTLRPGHGELLLAVSGGVDSMVLMDLLHRSGHAGSVVHFDHGLRGEEGRKDLELVRKEAERRGLPFRPIQLEAPDEHPERGIQNWGREERYRWLYHLLEREGLKGIATAHHADDRLETVLMGMLRGSGFRGVMGVPTEKERVIRPLNRVWKERIGSYAEHRGIPFREDPSNRSENYLRNRIRQELIPPFRNSFPEQEGALLRSLELLEASGHFLEEMGERERERILRYDPEKEEYRIPKAELRASRAPRVLFFELLRPFEIPHERAEELLHRMDGLSGALAHGEEWTLLRDREDFILTRHHEGPGSPKKAWTIPSLEESGAAPIEMRRMKKEELERSDRDHEAIIDLGAVSFPLTLRKVADGDRFRPFGMREGNKPVKEHLTDRKWPVHEKENALLLEDAEGWTLWVIGSTIDDRFRVDEGTDRVLWFRYSGA
jgi:tRNA(Ile)-lysidine synthase